LFVETGASQRSSRVIYDRLHTSFRTAEPGAYDWNRILDGAGWFHFTGTAPALGESVLNPLKEGIRLARQRGIPVSFDCSYRSALWSIAEAAPVFQELLHSVDVFFGSESDAQQFFGIQESGSQALKALAERYDLKLVAFSSRSVTPHGLNTCDAMVGNQSEVFSSRSHEIDPVDRIGAGDALAAAIIRGMLLGEPVERLAEQAICAAVLKHSIPGDFALLSWDEIQQLVNSSAGTASTRGWR
jgi:2-dehydro-3-deoxygluconokinase